MCYTAEELSEEDQQLKNELDMLVERLSVSGKRSFLELNYLPNQTMQTTQTINDTTNK